MIPMLQYKQKDLRQGSTCIDKKSRSLVKWVTIGSSINYRFSHVFAAHRGGPDGEGDEAGEGGDGDGDARVLHRQPEPLLQRQRAARAGVHVAERLRRHEHVVHACIETNKH